MTRDVLRITPGQTVALAAALMQEHNASRIAVEEGGKLVGVLSMGDIAVRAIVLSSETRIRDVMNEAVDRCYDDENADAAARRMTTLGVRRLPVVDRQDHMMGFVTLTAATRSPGVPAVH
ncbi:MAG: CBS domain-containing protein [Proteobacteria bacterium]|nr:CBS domain-containing protein [Pseudomonadota bacterium]